MFTIVSVLAERATFHTGAGALATSTKNTPTPTSWVARYASAMRCLRSPALQKITGTPGRAPRLDPPGEPARHPHQMRVVQLRVAVVVPASPPHAEPARVVPQREERVEHDPVHAVVAAAHQIRIPKAELVFGHPLNLVTTPPT